MNKPSVSVIIPVYNAANYIGACLESVISQSAEITLQIVAINDGSTDNSLKILNQYAQKHDYISVIDQENKGASEARRIALHHAEGEFIIFLDADDWLEHGCIKAMHDRCVEEGLDFLEVSFTYYTSAEQQETSKHRYTGQFTGTEMLDIVFRTHGELATTCAMSRKSIWSDDAFLPSEKRLPNEDIYPWFTIWKKINKAEIRNDMPIYYYRYNPDSVTNTGVLLRRQALWKEYFIYVRQRLRELGISQQYEHQLQIIEIDRLAFNVCDYDRSDEWYKQVINYSIPHLPLKYKILKTLLHNPSICQFFVRNNRLIKSYIKKAINLLHTALSK